MSISAPQSARLLGCQAQRLLEFLGATESETLYLVGDIVDGWQVRRRWLWHQSHNNVVQSVLKKARQGTEVIFAYSQSRNP